MPIKYVEPEVFFRYGDYTIYHIYKEDNIDMGVRVCHYGISPECSEFGGAFDVRDLPVDTIIKNQDDAKKAIMEAIDKKIKIEDYIIKF